MVSYWPSQLAVTLSALLLFLLQPIIAKVMLPHFGGTTAVWVATSVVFQLLLLLGYVYAYGLIACVSARWRRIIHGALLICSLPCLILLAGAGEIAERYSSTGDVARNVLAVVMVACGAPFVLLSATTPLLAASYGAEKGHGLFSFSNAGSFTALAVMPIALEPWVGLAGQSKLWSLGYTFVVVLVFVALSRATASPLRSKAEKAVHRPVLPLAAAVPLSWVGWSALGAAFLAATNLAMGSLTPGATLVWMLPLGAYLLSFVLVFRPGGYSLQKAFPWIVIACGLLAVPFIDRTSATTSLTLSLFIFPVGLFGVCYFCHGELARSQPQSERGIGFYYVCIAFGGVIGGSIVAFVCPTLFAFPTELPLLLVIVALALCNAAWKTLPRGIVVVPIILLIGVVVTYRVATHRFQEGVLLSERNLYGLLRIKDMVDAQGDSRRLMILGSTVHGVQHLRSTARGNPTSYFGPSSGAAMAIKRLRGVDGVTPKRIAVMGLGAGVVASYCIRGDTCDFFEINSAVQDAALAQFSFLEDADARGASINLFAGDGRRVFANQSSSLKYDLIVLDVFSDGLIPTHMLTQEALKMFASRLEEAGIVAVNVSSSAFQIGPNVATAASSVGLTAKFVDDVTGRSAKLDLRDETYPSSWVLLAKQAAVLDGLGKNFEAKDLALAPVWTDDFVHVFGALPVVRYLKAYFLR